MARPRKPVPADPPEVIAIRERMKPVDGTIVIRSPEFDAQWHLRWLNKGDNWFWRQCARYGYVKVKPGEVQTPGARGDTVAGEICHGDLILCKCPRAEWEARQRDKELFELMQLRGRMEGIKQAAESRAAGVTVDQELRVGEGDKEQTIKV